MTDDRFRELMLNDSAKLTQDEINQGYHFCYEWDGLLIGPESEEFKCCSCLPADHPAYKSCQTGQKETFVITTRPLENSKQISTITISEDIVISPSLQ